MKQLSGWLRLVPPGPQHVPLMTLWFLCVGNGADRAAGPVSQWLGRGRDYGDMAWLVIPLRHTPSLRSGTLGLEA